MSAIRRRLPPARQLWFQLHWLAGITAGSILLLIGLTGSMLVFREELLAMIAPTAPVHSTGKATALAVSPDALVRAAQAAHPQREIVNLTLFAEPGAPARAALKPLPGQGRGEFVLLDVQRVTVLPPQPGAAFFDWIESFHRWLLLPREPGRAALGSLAICLAALALSGMYLRWPRRVRDWRAWFGIDSRLRGHALLWRLHAVAGTLVLPCYLVFAVTGAYWSLDVVRVAIDRWAGVRLPSKVALPPATEPRELPSLPELDPAWRTFAAHAGSWSMASVHVAGRTGQYVQLSWVASDAPHDRARSRMLVSPDGHLIVIEPYGEQTVGQRAVTTFYPLHRGNYFGLPGRIVMFLAGLALPAFAATGWMLYLGRRRQQRAIARECTGHETAVEAASHGGPDAGVTLVAFATQTGHAERLALQTAAALQAAGRPVQVCSVSGLAVGQLTEYRACLFIASTFGEGGAPDTARRFSRELHAASLSLRGLPYAVLALGDRRYPDFCRFGQVLDLRMSALAGQRLFPPIEVDRGDAQALAAWRRALGIVAAIAVIGERPFVACELLSRRELNRGSQGTPLVELTLRLAEGIDWQAGDLVEIEVGSAAPRLYSIASLPSDGVLQLLVRQRRHGEVLGLASGWLTVQAPLGTAIRLRVVDNAACHGPRDDVPCIYIGNGSGMAGLRAHLRGRSRQGRGRNWLLFGDRQRAVDSLCADEIGAWRQGGMLPELDLVFSRDGEGEYVQDRLTRRADLLRAWLKEGAVIHVCGSMQGMAASVDAVLAQLLGVEGRDRLIAEGRYRRDVY